MVVSVLRDAGLGALVESESVETLATGFQFTEGPLWCPDGSLLFQDISDHLSKGGRVELRGFGVFSTRSREARMGRNPRTGQDVPVAAKKALHFKPGRQMLARLQAKPAD